LKAEGWEARDRFRVTQQEANEIVLALSALLKAWAGGGKGLWHN
jgi:hypothetical protein